MIQWALRPLLCLKRHLYLGLVGPVALAGVAPEVEDLCIEAETHDQRTNPQGELGL